MENEYIPLNECKNRVLYKIHSRNLGFGVFNAAQQGFVGIREKFDCEFLFTELHWDTGPPFGTVHPIKELESLPEDIEIRESLGTIDGNSGRAVDFDKERGWYFKDNDETSKGISPQSVENERLFRWLEEKEKQYGAL